MTSFALERGASIWKRCTLLLSKPTFVRKLAVIAALALVPCAADAKTIYVNAARANSGDGTSWTRAFKYLRDALDSSDPGDEIYVATGTYYPDEGSSGFIGDRELSFDLTGVSIFGGFIGNESNKNQRDPVANPTILSGEIWEVTPETPGYQRYWSLHVVNVKTSSILDGLIIEKGRANGDADPYSRGGGCYVQGAATLTLKDCILRGNLACEAGGAIAGNVIATGCLFEDNLVDNEFLLVDNKSFHTWLFHENCYGGAIYGGEVKASDCRFIDNTVNTSALNLGNTTSASGGAIYATTVTLSDCYFSGNAAISFSHTLPTGLSGSKATSDGGAVYASSVTAKNSIFVNNLAEATSETDRTPKAKTEDPPVPYSSEPTARGGAIIGRMDIVSCTFSGNSTFCFSSGNGGIAGGDRALQYSHGAALYVQGSSVVTNCALVSNYAGYEDITVKDRFSINSALGGAIYASSGSTLPITNCTMFDNISDGTGTALYVNGDVKILSNVFWDTGVNEASTFIIALPLVEGDSNAKVRISNRLYPSPSTETINIVSGGIDNIDVAGSNADLGDPPTRTILDPEVPVFADPTNAIGPDGIWRTADDGIRLTEGSPAINIGHMLFVPKDPLDVDDDGNTAENLPVDNAQYQRVQGTAIDLGAFEYGNILLAPEIQVEGPSGLALTSGVDSVVIGAPPGITSTRTLTIRNIGQMPLKRIRVTKSGANQDAFTISQPASSTLNANGSTTISVSFIPVTGQDLKVSLNIASTDADENPFVVNIVGQARNPDIGVEQPFGTNLTDGVSTVDFGTVDAITSASKTFRIVNSGEGDLVISSITVTGSDKSDFIVSSFQNTVPPGGGTTTFKVTFKPTVKGARVGVLSIKSNDPDAESNFTINLTGQGVVAPEIALFQPAKVELKDDGKKSFGEVKKGLSYTKTFTIKNLGSAKLKDLKVSLSGASDFSLVKPKVTSLASGAKTTFSVTFKPSSQGLKTTRLRIMSNDPDESPYDIELSGTGVKNSSAAKTSKSQLTGSSAIPGGKVTTVRGDDGLKYKVLTVEKTADWASAKRKVQVSSNLVDWFSGPKHTTVLIDDATTLKVRDNTPVRKGAKRHIRLK